MIIYLSGSASCAAFLSGNAPYAFVGFFAGWMLILSARARSEKRRARLDARRTALEQGAALRRDRSRVQLASYRDLIEGLARAFGRDPELALGRFSEGFLRRGRFDEGIRTGFEGPYVALIDGRGGDGARTFAQNLLPLFPGPPPLSLGLGGAEETAESVLAAVASWLEAHHQCLLVGADHPEFPLYVALARELADEVARLVPPDAPGALRPFGAVARG